MTINKNASSKIRLFFFAPDEYPSWRLDLSELFGVELAKKGIETTWSVWRDKPGPEGWFELYGQSAHLPAKREGRTMLARVLNQVFCNIADIRMFFHLLLKPRYDIIQVRDKRFFAAGLSLLAARLRGSKFTCWVSYPFPEHDLEKAKQTQGVMKFFYQVRGWLSGLWFYRFICQKADHVFVQSKQMRTDLNELYSVPLDKMSPVPMGVPKELTSWTSLHSTEVVSGRIVYVGTLIEVRRLGMIIDAFAKVKLKLPHAQLWMVGDGDVPEDRKKLEQHVEQAQLTDTVHFTGFIPMEKAWGMAASAEACLSPFYPTFVLRSTSPTKLNEYLALGRPCVANDHPEQADIIRESGGGLCVPWGDESFAEAIIWLLEHREEAEAMGAKGPDWIKANRTYDSIPEPVYAQYLSLLQQ